MKTHLNHIYLKTIDQIEPNASNKQGKMQRLTAFLHQIASPGYDSNQKNRAAHKRLILTPFRSACSILYA